MRTNRFVIGVVLAASLAMARGSVEAKEEHFHAQFAGIDTNKDDFTFPDGPPGAQYADVAGKSTLGKYTAQAVGASELDNKTCTPPGGGSGVEAVLVDEVWVLSFPATGEQLFLQLGPGVQLGCINPTTRVSSGQTTLDVIGGTGRFEGATGSLVKTFQAIALALPPPPGKGLFANFTGTLDGTIEFAQ
jgi:hypothetical protein